MPYLTPQQRRDLLKAKDTCGRCRLKLDALQEAVGGMEEEYAKLDRTQQAADRLLQLDQEERQ